MIALLDCIKRDHRWNSTYLMLEKALKYEHDLNKFKVVDKSYKHCPKK